MAAPRRFVGRDEDCDEIEMLLEANRLVSLVGSGGVGKTRLATELSARLAGHFAGGTPMIDLSGAKDRDSLEPVAARQLGVDSIDAFLLRTSETQTLVVLDNCESALEGARHLADELIDHSESVRVLATSRAPLRSDHECVFAVRPLRLPSVDDPPAFESPAVRLMIDCARAAGARWAVDESAVRDDVVALVRKLDGLPLAIELAAARARSLGPKELNALFDAQLDLLSRKGDIAPDDRHHSLRSVIDSSYRPLDPEEQRFFRALTTMSAPFDLELAHAVAGRPDTPVTESLERLEELVDASLVDATTDSEGRTSYRLLDSIRAFGREQLVVAGELERMREHHADAMADQADLLVQRALESFTPETLGRIRDRFVHLASAIGWCLDHDPSPARTYRMFIPFYGPTGARAEVADLARRVRGHWEQSAVLEAEAWAVMGIATFLNGDYEEGAALSERVLTHPDATDLARLWAHRTLGFAASLAGDPTAAAEHLDRAIEFARPFSGAFTRELEISRAAVATDVEVEPETLDALHRIASEAAREDEIVTLVWASVVGAGLRVRMGDLEGGRRSSEAAIAVADRTGLAWSIGTAHRTHGSVLAALEGWPAARPHFRRAFESTLAAGDIEGVAMAQRAAAGAALHTGDETLARALWSTIPPVRGLPVARSIFHDLEERLLREVGPPAPLDSRTLTRTARRLLADEGDASDRANAAPPTATPSEPEIAPKVLRFSDCELDLAMHELRRDGERVPIEPQVFDVLTLLVERRGSVVSIDELLDAVWNDRHVTPDSVNSRIAAARRATGDDGKRQRVIRTVRGKGFAFVAEIAGDAASAPGGDEHRPPGTAGGG